MKSITGIVCLLAGGMLAAGANQTSYVSAAGLDTNPCTEKLPCRTFQKAHDVTLTDGMVQARDGADYGLVNVDHSLVLDGGGVAMIATGTGVGVQIQAAGATVVVRNLKFTGTAASSIGVRLDSAKTLVVENVSMDGVGHGLWLQQPLGVQTHVSMRRATISGAARGVSTFLTAGTEPGRYMTVSLDDVTIAGSPFGLMLVAAKTTLRNSSITGCSDTAVTVARGELHAADSTLAYSLKGLAATDGALARITSMNVHGNVTAFAPATGGMVLSYGNNRVAANGSGENPSGQITLR